MEHSKMKPMDIHNLRRLLNSMKTRHDAAVKLGPYMGGYHEKSYDSLVARKLIGSLERAIEEIERRKS